MDLVETEKDDRSKLWVFTEIYIWASAKVHGRDTYEEYYRLKGE
jgi:hypothetical protein